MTADTGMRLVRREVERGAIGVGIADTPDGLWAIHNPGCSAAIWRRQPLPAFQAWIDRLDPQHLPQTTVTLSADAVRSALLAVCDSHGTPPGAMRERLVEDIAALASLFAGLMSAPLLRLRLETVTSNACSKFHMDAVTARLICTYRGTGTQYGIVTRGDTPRRVFTVPTGAPAVFRGTLCPHAPLAGVMHRSPPIEGTGEVRFVLVLDPI